MSGAIGDWLEDIKPLFPAGASVIMSYSQFNPVARFAACALGFLVMVSAGAVAQDGQDTPPRRIVPEEMERDTPHDQLDFFLGEWVGTFVADVSGLGYDAPIEFETRVSFEWMEPGRVWLREATVLDLPWGASFGQAMWAYDAGEGHYVRRWIDNQIPSVFFHEGFWVNDTTIVFDGHVAYAGGTIVMRDVVRITGADSYILEHFTDRGRGGEVALSSTTFYRRVPE